MHTQRRFLLSALLFIFLLPAEARNTVPSPFIKAQGRKLVLNGRDFLLKGVCFSNEYASIQNPEDLKKSTHHSARDYGEIAGMGLNAVRFAFRGDWYEKNPKAFFAWLDENISWAKTAGIYLILDLHVPIGGFWLDPTGDKVDFSLWTDSKTRRRNIELWKAIAARYRNEPTIAGYDVLNEPVTTDRDGGQWRKFAQDLVDAVRSVDKNHLIVIERLYGVNKSYTADGAQRQFLVKDDNVMYDFHFYEPIAYTHQYASWIDRPMGDGGKYPDADIVLPTGHQTFVTSLAKENPPSFKLNEHWTRFESSRFKIADGKIKMGIPGVKIAGNFKGTVYFDDLKIAEYDEKGRFVAHVVEEPFSPTSVWQWWNWHLPENGRKARFQRVSGDGANDTQSLAIADVSGPDGLSGWSSDDRWFKVKQGRSYAITGYMKASGPSVSVQPPKAYFDVAFYGNPDSGKIGFVARDKEYLKKEFMKFHQFGLDHNVPMSVLEFGLMHQCFEQEAKGGTKWVADILDIFLEHNVSFSYWSWRGDKMGIHRGRTGEPPGPANEPLVKTIRGKLGK